MNCEERIRELEEQLRELKEAWEADVEYWEERVSNLEDECRELRFERDEWRDKAEEWRLWVAECDTQLNIALEERNDARSRIRELEVELGCIESQYQALLTILHEELGHLETLIKNADWERATEQIAHIRKRYHAAIALHALQNQNTK